MNKIPNWYCSTKGLTVEQIAEALMFACEHGATELWLERTLLTKQKSSNFGVGNDGEAFLFVDKCAFGSGATELTYDQIKPFILGLTSAESA